jgi:hypothetical protein
MRRLLEDVATRCKSAGLEPPSRATVYKIMATTAGPRYRIVELPRAVREALYNLEDGSVVPGRQVAFYCFNYGDLEAMSFAAGLPWLALFQAGRLPGYRRKSRGLLQAAMRAVARHRDLSGRDAPGFRAACRPFAAVAGADVLR